METLNTSREVTANRIMNAHNLRGAMRSLKDGFSLHQRGADCGILNYELMDGAESVAHLDYCAECKHALVDTTFCDNCVELEERRFYESDCY